MSIGGLIKNENQLLMLTALLNSWVWNVTLPLLRNKKNNEQCLKCRSATVNSCYRIWLMASFLCGLLNIIQQVVPTKQSDWSTSHSDRAQISMTARLIHYSKYYSAKSVAIVYPWKHSNCQRWSKNNFKKYGLKFKLSVVKYAEEKSGEAAAKCFSVDPKRGRGWQ